MLNIDTLAVKHWSLQNTETGTESRDIRAYCAPQAADLLAFDLEQL